MALSGMAHTDINVTRNGNAFPFDDAFITDIVACADGESVIFASSRSGDVDLWEVSPKTNAVRRLTDPPASDWDPFVTVDGKHLLWSSNRTGNFEIWTAERDGSSPRQVSHDGYDAENPVATVDGWVAYASGNPQHPGLYKVRMDGTDGALVVGGAVAWPDVSPDGKYALYHIVSGALRAKIYVVRLADGACRVGPEGIASRGTV